VGLNTLKSVRRQASSIHASVGVIIAILANTWSMRIIPPFVWGLIWCARLALRPRPSRSQHRRSSWAVYAAEYIKAVAGSLVLSLTVGSLKALFRYLVLG
jgi:hypothetical protein